MHTTDLLARLEGVKKAAGGWIAKCPAHDDRNPSLSVSERDGKLLLKCHAGCTVEAIAQALGLTVKDLFSSNGNGSANTKGETRPIIATHPYTDAQGRVLFQKARFATKPKTKPRHIDPSGKWIWGAGTDARPLYRLPAILKAQEVCFTEGEKDADNLVKLGFEATCTPFGKLEKGHVEALTGKDVFLFWDDDDPGRKKRDDAVHTLQGVAKTIRTVDLPTDGKPEGYDVSDFIAEYPEDPEAAKEKLCVLMAEAKAPPKPLELRDAILTAETFRQIPLPEKRIILNPWISERIIALISGWRGVGKTWFGTSIVEAVTRGEPFGPWQTKTPVPSLYLDGEMAAQDVQQRIRSDSDRKAPLYIYSDAYANSIGIPRAALTNDLWREAMTEILTSLHVKLFVVDNIASLASGLDENAKQDWDAINEWLIKLRFQGISTILLHHTGKGGEQRGTSAREDNIDVSLILKPPPGYSPEDGASFVVTFTKSRIRTADLPLITDTHFKLQETERGESVWTYQSVKAENLTEALKMFDNGASNKDVAEALDLSKGYVSKLKHKAIKDGYLDAKGNLTQSGFHHVY